MHHAVLYRDENAYSPWPVLWRLPDGGIGAGVVTSPVGSHPGASVFGRFLAFVSPDEGRSWEASGDPAHPANWPAATADERMDRFAVILPDGTFVAVGARGFEAWEAGRLEEAGSGLGAGSGRSPSGRSGSRCNRPFLCCQRSSDGGRTWERREWEVAGVRGMWCFNRGTVTTDETVVVGVYGVDQEGLQRPYALRSADRGRTWRLHDLCAHAAGVPASEAAICETGPGRLTALVRGESDPHDHRLLQLWSEDGGRTWSEPARTGIWGHPAHLLKLERRAHPLHPWVPETADGGARRAQRGRRRDLGYGQPGNPAGRRGRPFPPPRARERAPGTAATRFRSNSADGEVLTAYYITPADNVTHSAVTIWRALTTPARAAGPTPRVLFLAWPPAREAPEPVHFPKRSVSWASGHSLVISASVRAGTVILPYQGCTASQGNAASRMMDRREKLPENNDGTGAWSCLRFPEGQPTASLAQRACTRLAPVHHQVASSSPLARAISEGAP